MRGEAPWLELGRHVSLMLESVISLMMGRVGGPGKANGSGALRKMMCWSFGVSTISVAFHVVSPVSLDARQVYTPVSIRRRSSNINQTQIFLV